MQKTRDRSSIKRMYVLLDLLPVTAGHAGGTARALTNRLRGMGVETSTRTIHRDLRFFEGLGLVQRTAHEGREERWKVSRRINVASKLRPMTEPQRPLDLFWGGDEDDGTDVPDADCSEYHAMGIRACIHKGART